MIAVIVLFMSAAGGFLFLRNRKAPERITIAVARQPVFALIFIAQALGYFRNENLDVTLKMFDLGRDALDDMIAGKSDMATVYETPLVRRVHEGKAVSILTTLHTSTKNTALLVRTEKKITNISDIKGSIIGVPKQTSAEFFLNSYLTGHGLRISDVTLKDINPEDMKKSLEDGSVDGVAIWNPYLYQLEQNIPKNQRSVLYSDTYTETSVLAVRTDTLAGKKPGYTAVLKALVQAEIYAKTYREDSIRIVARFFPDLTESNIRDMWQDFTLSLKMDNLLLTLLNRESQWFEDNGIYPPERIQYRNVMVPELLRTVKPGGVTVY